MELIFDFFFVVVVYFNQGRQSYYIFKHYLEKICAGGTLKPMQFLLLNISDNPQ